MDVFVILHDIRSMENVGSILRTADAVGVSKIYLTGYTPAPLDRFGRKNTKLIKASLGAEDFVLWEKRDDILGLVTELKKNKVRVVAVEQSSKSISYEALKSGVPTAFIFGNEVDGLSDEIITTSDVVIEIPMRGKKESLNVSVAAGIVLFRCV